MQENGIDLRVGELYTINEDDGLVIGCIDDKKWLPELEKVKLVDDNYKLEPQTYYFVKVDRDIEIPNGYTQTYLIRSTFARCGLQLISSVGDNGFKGTLMMGLYNTNKKLFIPKQEIVSAEGPEMAHTYGDKFIRFIIYNLKPLIDKTFHTSF